MTRAAPRCVNVGLIANATLLSGRWIAMLGSVCYVDGYESIPTLFAPQLGIPFIRFVSVKIRQFWITAIVNYDVYLHKPPNATISGVYFCYKVALHHLDLLRFTALRITIADHLEL